MRSFASLSSIEACLVALFDPVVTARPQSFAVSRDRLDCLVNEACWCVRKKSCSLGGRCVIDKMVFELWPRFERTDLPSPRPHPHHRSWMSRPDTGHRNLGTRHKLDPLLSLLSRYRRGRRMEHSGPSWETQAVRTRSPPRTSMLPRIDIKQVYRGDDT